YTDMSDGGNVGIGFAIPINSVRDMLPGLKTGKVARGVLGVSVERQSLPRDLTAKLGLPSQQGALISRIAPGGAAEAAGLKIKDVVVGFSGQTVHDDNELVNMVMGTTPGTTVALKVYRGGKAITINAKVGELNLEQENAAGESVMLPQLPDGQKTAVGL